MINSSLLRAGLRVEMLSLGWMVIEAAVALDAGWHAQSPALVFFGTDSLIELFAGSVLAWRLLVELQGGDWVRVERAEKTASWLVGLSLLLLAVAIPLAVLLRLGAHDHPEVSFSGLGLTILSGLLMPLLAKAKYRLGKQGGSAALAADGSCSMVCAYMAWTVLAGLAANALFGWWWADAAAALGVAYFAAREGLEAVAVARGKSGCGCCKQTDIQGGKQVIG